MFDENETGEQIQERRNIIKKEYQEIYKLVSNVLFVHDPIGINFETNDDEYEPEVDTLLPRLKTCNSAEDVLNVVFEEFQEWFGEETAGEKSNYKEIAEEVWELWRKKRG